MRIKVYWEYPDFYTSEDDDTSTIIEEPDDATEEQIEKDVRETALEHFDWSYERIDKR